MKFTLDEIEEYEDSLDHKELEELYNRLEKSMVQIENCLLLKGKTKLNFKNYRNLTSIYTQNNEININKKFIIAIIYYLFQDSKDENSLMFKGLLEERFNTTFLLIREFIIEFILFHELFHVKQNHNEIKENGNEQNINEHIELDADRKAIQFLISKYFLIITKYGIKQYYYLIEKYIYAILCLHKFLIIIDDDKNNSSIMIRNIRLIFSLSTIIEIKNKHPEFIAISIDELIEIQENCLDKFLVKNGNIFKFDESSISEINKLAPSFFNFLRRYD